MKISNSIKYSWTHKSQVEYYRVHITPFLFSFKDVIQQLFVFYKKGYDISNYIIFEVDSNRVLSNYFILTVEQVEKYLALL